MDVQIVEILLGYADPRPDQLPAQQVGTGALRGTDQVLVANILRLQFALIEVPGADF